MEQSDSDELPKFWQLHFGQGSRNYLKYCKTKKIIAANLSIASYQQFKFNRLGASMIFQLLSVILYSTNHLHSITHLETLVQLDVR